jgi:hypothetical protein
MVRVQSDGRYIANPSRVPLSWRGIEYFKHVTRFELLRLTITRHNPNVPEITLTKRREEVA